MTRPDTPEYSSNAAMALSRPQLRRFYFDFRTDRHRCRSAGDRCRLKQTRKPPECTKYICCVQLKVEFYAMFIMNFCALHKALITGWAISACHSHKRSARLPLTQSLALLELHKETSALFRSGAARRLEAAALRTRRPRDDHVSPVKPLVHLQHTMIVSRHGALHWPSTIHVHADKTYACTIMYSTTNTSEKGEIIKACI